MSASPASPVSVTPPFVRSATVYDRVYAARGKDYRREAEAIVTLAADRGVGGGTLLDVACGTGAHLAHLAAAFDVEGLDICPQMLAVTRDRLPGVTLHRGDMTAFDLGRGFDVVTCLFASIGYLDDADAMRRAVAAMARHLRPGGVLVLEPAVTPDRLRPPRPQHLDVGDASGRIVRHTTARHTPDRLIITFEYELGDDGSRRCFREEHRIAVLDDDVYEDALAGAGIEAERVTAGGLEVYAGARLEGS